MSDQLQFGERPGVQTSAGAPVPVPAKAEFVLEGVPWRCGRMEALAAEFDVGVADLAGFVGAARVTERGWLITRRLFGLGPVVPPPTASLEDLRPWTRGELQEALGLTRAQLAAELDAVRGAWRAMKVRSPESKVQSPEPEAKGLFSEEELLEKHGLALKFSSAAEKTWFARRVQDYERILAEKFAAELGRNALLTELRIYQLDGLLNDAEKCKPGDTSWHANLKVRQQLGEQYHKMLDQIKGLCPWAGGVAGKYAFAGAIAEVTKAIQNYYARGDTALIDTMCTLTEVLVDTRTSVQMPDPHYRADLRVFVAEAKANLWNFRWQPALELPRYRHLQRAWQAAWQASHEADFGKVPDLANDGPEGEYEALPKELTNLVNQADNHQNHEGKPN